MQDDAHKKRSFEQLDETQTERNDRSWFDWLTGKETEEESDEKRLRKKLDKELKEAARKRAEQFEEERRIEEKRDIAETRKLKKRWRKKLFEKSKKQLEEAELAADQPADGYTVAKLMVAERIVKLHDMLETEDLRRSEIKTLKIHIDFMGLLSEKLDRPELEVPDEVQQLYETIAESVEKTPTDPQTTPEVSEPTPEPSNDEVHYRAFAATIVRAIRRVVKPLPATATLGTSAVSDASEHLPYASAVPVLASPESPQTSPKNTERAAPVVAAGLLAIIHEEAQPAQSIREEIHRGHAVRRLAEVVEHASATLAKPEPEIMTRPTTANPEQTKRERSIQTERLQKTEQIQSSEFPTTDLEFWSEADLVRKARTVALGSGRYLAEAYTRGTIDKAGLIKVLKSYMKGRDYRTEFFRRSEAFRQSQRSPEVVAPTISQPNEPATQPDLATDDSPVRPTTQQQPRTIYSNSTQTKVAEQRRKLSIENQLKKRANRYLLGASVLLIGVIFAIVIALNHG